MPRKRKNPTGAEGETLLATLGNSGHVAKVGEREFLRVPDIKQDMPDMVRDEPENGQTSKAREILFALENTMLCAALQYKYALCIQEAIKPYLLAEGVGDGGKRKWVVPSYLQVEVMKAIDNAKQCETVSCLNRFAAFYFDSTVSMPNEIPVK